MESRSEGGGGASHVYVWGESVVIRQNNQCKGPEHAWHLSSTEAIAAEAEQALEKWERIGLESWGCRAMQGCSKDFGFVLRDMGVCKPHHIHTMS